jgi:glycosyltransferase involved in cell wall biosynthesis
MKRIVILNGNHLCHNPRVIKEASALAAAGFDVEVLGASLLPALEQRDKALLEHLPFRYTPVVRLGGKGVVAKLMTLALKGERWIAVRLKSRLDLDTHRLLGYGMSALLRQARARRADLYIAHSEPALWVARILAGEGRRVGVDMEDWFSEDLLPEARRGRPLELLRGMESDLLKVARHRTCTSEAMSRVLAATYGCEAPLVIYNAFPWQERAAIDGRRKDRREDGARMSIHWFSQSIGPGRGLEDLFAALPLLHDLDAELHLRGSLWDGYREWLRERLPESWRTRIFIHPLVPNEELLSRIAEHDVGVALEPALPQSRNLTVTNKILQYLQAGLGVVATATLGQREVAAQATRAVQLCRPGDPADLAACLRRLLADRGALQEAKQAALAAARDRLSWEKVSPLLVASVEQAVS